MAAQKAPAPLKPRAPKLRVSYVLGGGTHETRHCFGVSALASHPGRPNLLYSAGRDSLVFLWETAPQGQHLRSFRQHTDWVNDLFLAEEGRVLVTASSDTTVKVWDAETAGVIKSISKHTDYVKALAYAPKIRCFASAGLDKAIYLWDLERGTSTSSVDVVSGRSPLEGQKDSIYSLAVNSSGTRLVSGSTENVIRVWDPRDGKKTMKLKGHTDNVKAVLVNEDGTQVLSGSSDGSLRLWDLGQKRSILVLDPHADSVWTLAADESFSRVYSGGRDKRVFLTDLASGESTLLFEEEQPVVRLLLQQHAPTPTLWSTSTSPSIHGWSVQDVVPPPKRTKFASPDRAQLESSSPSGAASSRTASAIAHEGNAQISAPRVTLAGRAGIVKHVILNNRRQILTADTAGRVALWDVLRGTLIQDLGDKESIDDHSKRLFEMLAIANWFSVDTRTGAVTINLDAPQCFTGECFNEDLTGQRGDSLEADRKVNLGEAVLAALFANWLNGVRAAAAAAAPLSPPSSPDPGPSEPEKSAAKKEKKEKKEKEEKRKEKERRDDDDDPPPPPPVLQISPETPITVSDESSGVVLLRTTIAQLTGREGPGLIPHWVIDAVEKRILPARESQKVQFTLLPVDPKESKKSWREQKLTGTRGMRLKRVVDYVVGKSGLELKMPVDSATDTSAAREWPSYEVVEILCAKQLLDHKLTLAAVRQYVWKSSDDLVLYYRFTEKYRNYLNKKAAAM